MFYDKDKEEAGVRKIRSYCRNCGKEIIQKEKRKQKRFCNDSCRYEYWNTHRDEAELKAINATVCIYCGKEFKNYGNKERKYCNHPCYIADRFGREKLPRQEDEASAQRKREEALVQYAKGNSCGSIAKEMNISINTVKSWIRRYAQQREP